MKLPTDNLGYPCRLLIGNSSGSGFLIEHNNHLYLVTAKHVLYQEDPLMNSLSLSGPKMKITSYPLVSGRVSTQPRVFDVDVEALLKTGDLKAHETADVAVVKLGSVTLNNGTIQTPLLPAVKISQTVEGSTVHYAMKNARRFEDVEITNDIYVLGYPISLSTPEMKQIDYDSPLVRKGIVAGKNHLNKSLILDCPIYGGNSGGLVLEMNETEVGHQSIYLIGVVVQFVPFVDQWRNVKFPQLYNTNLQNSGYSVALPVDYIFDLIGEIEIN